MITRLALVDYNNFFCSCERLFNPALQGKSFVMLFDLTASRIDLDRIVDEINRRMGDLKNPVITLASQGTMRSGKGWRMRPERHSPH